jgi:hypothetical protein
MQREGHWPAVRGMQDINACSRQEEALGHQAKRTPWSKGPDETCYTRCHVPVEFIALTQAAAEVESESRLSEASPQVRLPRRKRPKKPTAKRRKRTVLSTPGSGRLSDRMDSSSECI